MDVHRSERLEKMLRKKWEKKQFEEITSFQGRRLESVIQCFGINFLLQCVSGNKNKFYLIWWFDFWLEPIFYAPALPKILFTSEMAKVTKNNQFASFTNTHGRCDKSVQLNIFYYNCIISLILWKHQAFTRTSSHKALFPHSVHKFF